MSGVYISGVKMPKECQTCIFARLTPTGESIFCCIVGFTVPWADNKRSVDCPMIEVPNHGDLIDADGLIVRMKKDPLWKLVDQYGVESVIEAAPTIIPADKEET